MRLAGANNCVVAKEHGCKWKPRAATSHRPRMYSRFMPIILVHATSLIIDVSSTPNKP